MEFHPDILKQLWVIFAAELDEQIQVITDGLLQLEKADLPKGAQENIMDEIFRAAHNIKGAARGVEQQEIGNMSHKLESLFSRFKNQNITPSAEKIDLCFTVLDAMRNMSPANKIQAVNYDVDMLCRNIDLAINDDMENISSVTKVETESDSEPVENTFGSGLEADIASHSITKSVDIIKLPLQKIDKVAELTDELLIAKNTINNNYQDLRNVHLQVGRLANMWQTMTRPDTGMLKQIENHPLGKLLQNSLDLITGLHSFTSHSSKEMRASAFKIEQLSYNFQKNIRMLQLVPVSDLLQPLHRTVRDIAKQLDKQVTFIVKDNGIEMDRKVLDGIRDPLMHLIRNAVDHGIETAEQRLAQGKSAQGNIAVNVIARGSQIYMTIRDDGAGLAPEKITAAAVRKNIITQEQADVLDQDGVADLIFRPGLSSKDMITDISGRGVGLDVVRSNLQKLKGEVSLESRQGEGTTFTLRVPLTLTSERGVIVRIARQSFAIPSTAIVRLLEITAADIVEVEASQVIMLHGKPIPIHHLAGFLNMPVPEGRLDDHYSVVVISTGLDPVAFVVDEVLTEQEIVIKPLMQPLTDIVTIAGATEFGNGEITLVLDTHDLLNAAYNKGMTNASIFIADSTDTPEVPKVLIVDDSITTRTLEKTILENQGYDVTVAIDGKQGWDSIQSNNYDLVITDVEMPNMNGFELTAKIKQSAQYQHLPVIIVSSLSKETERKKGLEAGADAYIVKGQFESRALLEVVRQLL